MSCVLCVDLLLQILQGFHLQVFNFFTLLRPIHVLRKSNLCELNVNPQGSRRVSPGIRFNQMNERTNKRVATDRGSLGALVCVCT